MSPEDILTGAAFFLAGALTTFAIWVPKGRGVQPAPPTARPQGWAPRPPPGYTPAGVRPSPPPSGTGASGPMYFDAVPPPPPKVYPDGQAPRRAPPADYKPVAHVRDVHIKDGCIRWTETATVVVPDGVRVRFVNQEEWNVPVIGVCKTHPGGRR